jgi:hypothetical protein
MQADYQSRLNEDNIDIAYRYAIAGGAPMISSHTTQVAERAKAIYSRRLQADLESAHPNRYVAIEPESGEHFVADSFGDSAPWAPIR